MKSYSIFPIGFVHKDDETVYIDLDPEFRDGLLGLDGFSHIVVLYWFDQNDTPENRRVLQVHPRKDQSLPLTGVFATHSPVRPNLIAVTHCQIESIRENRIYIDRIDALDGSPVIDIKSYIPPKDMPEKPKIPDWV